MKNQLFTQSRGTGSDVVLLHGWGLNSGVWEPMCETLQQHHRVTLVDLPGFGRNADYLPDDYSLEMIADWLADYLPQNCTLVGWSLGGLIAQQLALSSVDKISKLILVASSPKFTEADQWPGIKPPVLAMFEQQLERDFSKTLDRFMAIQAMGSDSAKRDIKTIKRNIQDYPIPDERALRAGLQLLANTDLRTQIKHISVPTYRLYGRLDSLVPHKAIDQIAALQTHCQSKIFAHASHAPFISHPDEFLEYLLEILAEQ